MKIFTFTILVLMAGCDYKGAASSFATNELAKSSAIYGFNAALSGSSEREMLVTLDAALKASVR